MLAPHDLVAAKILAQLRLVHPNFLRGLLDQLSRARGHQDLLARLVGQEALTGEQSAHVQRYVARFFRVVHESAVLQEAERRGLPPSQVCSLLAQVEVTGHVLRLTEVLSREGLFTPGQAWELEEAASQFVFLNGVRMIELYRAQNYAGVSRPLIVDGSISAESFRVSRMFRDRATQSAVIREIGNFGVEESDTDKIEVSNLDFSDEEDTVGIEQAPVRLHGRKRPRGPDLRLEFIGGYRVLECLGRGGMGAVFLTESPSGGQVAVKVLLPNAPPDDRARFEREATMCARVQHPCVVEVLDKGTTSEGMLYLVLPAYPSAPLRKLIREGTVTAELAFDVVDQLLDALSAVHAAGIVHRDVKPENLLVLTGTTAVRLVDFGISRFVDESAAQGTFRTARGVASGSPTYVAPETLSEGPFDARTDLYSVGVLFFELLAGRPPFQVVGKALGEVVRQHMVVPPPTLADVRPEVYWCPELELLIGSLLSKIPRQRPPSARAVLDLLRSGLRTRSLELIGQGAPAGRDPGSSWDEYTGF